MINLKKIFPLLLFATMVCCGRNEDEKKTQSKNSSLKETKAIQDTIQNDSISSDLSLNPTKKQFKVAKTNSKLTNNDNKNTVEPKLTNPTNPVIPTQLEITIDSPLKQFLNKAQIGKSYSKKELIDKFNFPKAAVNLVKSVTLLGENKLYFHWGSTWMAEKFSDAKFKNDTMHFAFKKNDTYISGGAIGIKYNKKIYTDLILKNGSAYIPSVKGYHWEITKK